VMYGGNLRFTGRLE